MKNTRTRPPSRIRYEESHPVISFRIKKEWYDELKNLLRTQGITIADFFKIALEKQKENQDKVWEEAYEEGYDIGFGRFEIPCKICGKPMKFDFEAEQKTERIVKEAFKDWGHSDCLEKEKRSTQRLTVEYRR